MRKILVLLVALASAGVVFAWGPHGHGFHGPHPVRFGHHHHHHHHGACGWGIAAGVIGAGIVGAALYDAVQPRVQVVQPAPVVVQQPVVVQPAPVVVSQPVVQPAPVVVQQPIVQQPVTQVQSVWVEGRYVDQVQSNGSVVRTWQPGHYEQRSVVIQ